MEDEFWAGYASGKGLIYVHSYTGYFNGVGSGLGMGSYNIAVMGFGKADGRGDWTDEGNG